MHPILLHFLLLLRLPLLLLQEAYEVGVRLPINWLSGQLLH
jgi:hypothetical protein